MRVIKWLDEHFEETLLVALLITVSCVMMAQIIARYIFNDSMPWPEEFGRYCYIWSVFLSLSFSIKKGNILRVGVVMDLLPVWLRTVIRIITDVVMLALFAVFFLHSIEYTGNIRATGQLSSAMRLPMWIMYCATVTGFGLAIIRTVQTVIHNIFHFNDKVETTLEATLKEAEEEAKAVAAAKSAGLSAAEPLQGGEV